MSLEAIDRRQKKNYARLQSLTKINREKLDKADQLNYDLFQREIKTRIEEYQFKPWMFANRTFDGPQLLAEVAEFAPFTTVKDYDNWIARLNTTGIYVDQWILLLTQGTDRATHAAAHHHQQGARTAQGPAHRRPRGQPVLCAFQEDAGGYSRRRAGTPHRRRQGRGAGRGDPGLPALRQVLPRRLSTGVARHRGHLRHSRRRAVLPQPHQATTPPSTTWMRRASTTSASRK